MLAINELHIGPKTPLLPTSISLNAHAGEIWAILGRNGAGKSTLLRTMAGFQKPISGEVCLDQKRIHRLPLSRRARLLSWVTATPPRVQQLSVYELIALGRQPHTGFWGKLQPKDQQAVEHALTRVGLTHLRHKNLTALSDGEKQKVFLARAVAQETPLLLLDEPTSHLDFIHRLEVFQMLQQLTESRRRLIFVVTHEINLALRFAHRILLLSPEEVFIGTPEEAAQVGFLKAYNSYYK